MTQKVAICELSHNFVGRHIFGRGDPGVEPMTSKFKLERDVCTEMEPVVIFVTRPDLGLWLGLTLTLTLTLTGNLSVRPSVRTMSSYRGMDASL